MSDQQPAVIVKDLYKSFKLPHEQHNGIKQVILNFAKRKQGYEVQHVLDDISFEIQKGEFFGIVGRNGSGKSTLLKLLAGIYTPDRGLVQVNGSLTPFIELGVGFNPELTGRENVFMNGALLGFSRPEMEAMYGDIVSFAELEKFMDQKLKNYSSGMQVRLAFSIAIRAQSDILLLDEVLAVGDAAFQQKCFNYFEELKRLKKTIIFVSHDMSAVTRFCDKAIYLKDGRLLTIGSPEEISDIYVKENIETEQQAPVHEETGEEKEELLLDPAYTLSSKIVSDTESQADIEFSYTSPTDSDVYIGLSIAKGGISLAEITTPPKYLRINKGTVKYTIDKTIFNAGGYTVGAGLFDSKNRALLAVTKKRLGITVSGKDSTRGGALKLEQTWQ